MRVSVFPTRVGVNPEAEATEASALSFPHPRGGEPVMVKVAVMTMTFSPPAWG